MYPHAQHPYQENTYPRVSTDRQSGSMKGPQSAGSQVISGHPYYYNHPNSHYASQNGQQQGKL